MLAVTRGIHRFDGRFGVHYLAVPVARTRRSMKLAAAAGVRSPFDDRALPAAAQAHAAPVDAQVTARIDVDAALATLRSEFRAAVVLRDLCDSRLRRDRRRARCPDRDGSFPYCPGPGRARRRLGNPGPLPERQSNQTP